MCVCVCVRAPARACVLLLPLCSSYYVYTYILTYIYTYIRICVYRCNFDNLSILVAVTHCALPLLAIPLTFVLIPNKLMTDKIIEVCVCLCVSELNSCKFLERPTCSDLVGGVSVCVCVPVSFCVCIHALPIYAL